MSRAKADALRTWHATNAPQIEKLGVKVRDLIAEVLGGADEKVQSVTYRTKTVDRFVAKADRLGTTNPEEVYDACGVRVITYFEAEMHRVAEQLRQLFEWEESAVKDKTEDLGRDKLGYRAKHLVGKLPASRVALADWRPYRDRTFEVQVTTLLSHAWSEFEHGRSYELGEGGLPPKLDRRLRLAAGLLETADRELDQIAEEVDLYRRKVAAEVEGTQPDSTPELPVDWVSLQSFFAERYPNLETVLRKPVTAARVEQVLRELGEFGVHTLADVEALLPDDVSDTFDADGPVSLATVLRRAMLLRDAERYFSSAWHERWTGMTEETQRVLTTRGIDVEALAKKYGIAPSSVPGGEAKPEAQQKRRRRSRHDLNRHTARIRGSVHVLKGRHQEVGRQLDACGVIRAIPGARRDLTGIVAPTGCHSHFTFTGVISPVSWSQKRTSSLSGPRSNRSPPTLSAIAKWVGGKMSGQSRRWASFSRRMWFAVRAMVFRLEESQTGYRVHHWRSARSSPPFSRMSR